jgi:CBS domain-containing protein
MLVVRDLMTQRVVSVGPHATLKQAAETLLDRGISGLPVVDEHGAVLGVLSESDIVAKTAQGAVLDELRTLVEGGAGGARTLTAATAGEAMSTPPVTIGPDAPIADAARLLATSRVNRLPVIEGGRLVGILTRADVVRSFARPDSEVWEEIRTDLAEEPFGLDPDAIEITVEGGRVRLAGEVAGEATAELVAAHVRAIPGVVTVDSSALAAANGTQG